MIEVVDLCKSFPTQFGLLPWLKHRGRLPRRTALRNVSLEIGRGELFGLVGPNGAGKTTLLKLIASLSIPDRGAIVVNGIDAVQHPMAVKRQIGLCIGEERSFYFRLTVRQNMEFFAALAGLHGRAARRQIAEVVKLVDLAQVTDARFDSLSSGMRQRLSLARALLADPPVLLADEPTRGVDPVHAEAIRKLLRDELVTRRGKTVLLTTNLLEEAWSVCDTVAVLNRGAIVTSGSPRSIAARFKRRLRYDITIDRLSDALLARLRAVGGVNLIEPESLDDGVALRIDLEPSAHTLTDLLRALSANGTLVRDLRSENLRPTDLFGEDEGPSDGA